MGRKQMQFVVQVYLPSAMFVIVSWVSFMVKPEVVPGRMAMLVTLFLVLINIFNSVREQAPISSRLNAVDLYLVVCVFFVFSALMEYAAILLLLKKRRRPRKTIDEGLKSVFPLVAAGAGNGDVNQTVQRPERKKIIEDADFDSNGLTRVLPPNTPDLFEDEGERGGPSSNICTVMEPGPRAEQFQNRAAGETVTAHKQALCDNIDAWALWVSPPVF